VHRIYVFLTIVMAFSRQDVNGRQPHSATPKFLLFQLPLSGGEQLSPQPGAAHHVTANAGVMTIAWPVE
jgi:hypothetical protein